MEYCSEGDLYGQITTEGMLSESRARLFFRQIVEAVRFIHDKSIVHRDLKPDNILITEQFTVKLADFGFCRVAKTGRLLTTPCGSPLYVAPELLLNHCYDGKCADVWSLGILLFTMVTGRLPWTTENQVELFRQIREAEIGIPFHLTLELQDLLGKMLERDPAARITIPKIIESPWFSARKSPPGKGLGRASTDSPRRVGFRIVPVLQSICLAPGRANMEKDLQRLVFRPRRVTAMGLAPAHSFRRQWREYDEPIAARMDSRQN
jgi:serine/threonine protein kinase